MTAFANMGDTQAYVVRRTENGTAELIWRTEGHAHGMAEADSLPMPPERISHFLDGRPEGHAPGLVALSLSAGDRVPLCTGGLGAVVSHALLMESLSGPGGSAEAADRLEAIAVGRAGSDDITLIVIEFVDFEVHRKECTFSDQWRRMNRRNAMLELRRPRFRIGRAGWRSGGDQGWKRVLSSPKSKESARAS
ncbi:hypothetical protein [Nonomuraea sp. NPDC001699]